MKQQVIFLSWGTPKENYSSYYDSLYEQDFDLYEKVFKNRKYSLWQELWEAYEYHIVKFPNKSYADYTAWKITFEKIIPFLKDDVVFVATSLWGSFITKYLSENILPHKITKLIMLAPALFEKIPEWTLWGFLWNPDLFSSVSSQCDKIYIYHSTDDTIVPFSDSEKYLKLFPNAIFRKFSDKWHFNFEERIIEVEEDIKK